jgi:hypothetical protein
MESCTSIRVPSPGQACACDECTQAHLAAPDRPANAAMRNQPCICPKRTQARVATQNQPTNASTRNQSYIDNSSTQLTAQNQQTNAAICFILIIKRPRPNQAHKINKQSRLFGINLTVNILPPHPPHTTNKLINLTMTTLQPIPPGKTNKQVSQTRVNLAPAMNAPKRI